MHIHPNRALKGLRDTSNGNMSPQLLAEYIQYQCINSTDRYSSIFPELWEWIFSFPSCSRILGMYFFHSLPGPEFWEWDFFIPFPFPNFGNVFFHSLPFPEFLELFISIPFPFPNSQKSFPLYPGIVHFK